MGESAADVWAAKAAALEGAWAKGNRTTCSNHSCPHRGGCGFNIHTAKGDICPAYVSQQQWGYEAYRQDALKRGGTLLSVTRYYEFGASD